MCGVRPNQGNSTVFTKTWKKTWQKPKNCRKSPKVTPKIGRLPQIWCTPLHEGPPTRRTPLHEGPPTRRTPLHPFARRLGGFLPPNSQFWKEKQFFPIFASFKLFCCSSWAHGAFFLAETFLPGWFHSSFQKTKRWKPDQTALAKGQRLRNRDGSTPVGLVFRAQAKKINKMVEFRSLTRSSQDEEGSLSPQKTPDFPTKQFRDTFLRLSLRFRISAASLQNCKSTSHFRLKIREAITY